MKEKNFLSSRRFTLFRQACSLGIPEVVVFMLEKRLIDINVEKSFIAAFCTAVMSKREKIAEILLVKRNLSVNTVSAKALCYLAHIAYNYGMFAIAKKIINYGYADLAFKTDGTTILHKAVIDQNVDFVDFLLTKQELNILQEALDGTTPITAALIKNDDVEMAYKLLNARELSYYKGFTQAFLCAVTAFHLGAKELSTFILNIPDIKISDDDLFLLAMNDHFELLAEVLKLPQANVNATSFRFAHGSLLSFIITKNRCDIVDIMLNHEQLNINQECSYMPLATAVEMGNKEIVQKLLQRCDVDVNAYGWRQEPPVVTAIKYPEILKILLDKCEVNLKETNSKGNTALIEAVSANMYESVDLLLKNKNININSSTQDFSGLIKPHIRMNSIQMCRVFFKVGPYASIGDCANASITALHIAIAKGYEDIALRLLKFKRVKCSLKMPNGTTLLQWAIYNGMYKVVEKLIKRPDVSVNEIPDTYPMSPLMICARNGNIEIFKLLLAHEDVDVNAENVFGNTVLAEVYKDLHIYGSERLYNYLELLLEKPELDLYVQSCFIDGPDAKKKKISVINAVVDNALLGETSVLKLFNKYRPDDVQKILATKTYDEQQRLNSVIVD